ncbi:MAG: hypothetical protein D8M58_07015 [Calditrichaeota bacterium]|nr:MAG: hypothetical protein DWQ03_19485 [Calditrichota bacterium]MBL1205130.1 hypothetical protein [Calditrichota bacterium]NOG44960.1 hypothetical protein [Calditrichota bacterium]
MAKKSKKTKQIESTKKTVETKSINLSDRKQDYIFLVILTAILVFILKPMVIDGLSPQGVDVLASIGTNHKVLDWTKESGDKALWNPNVFAGMPRYQRIPPVTFSIDTILNWLGRFFNNIFIYYLFGGIGAYLFLRYLKMSPVISFAGAITFVLMPHYKSLFLEGHNTKLRALLLLPWISLTFKYFLDKRSLLGAVFFALAFGTQIRTQHYQIVFYTGLLVFAIGIYPILQDLIKKNYTRFTKSSFLIIAAVTLAIMTASQPLFLAKEYLPWSKRGKTTINLADPAKTKSLDKSDGVSIEYATQWSTAPSELLTWAIPRYYGGMSREKYTGDAIPQLKGQEIPGYWGEMPFTQSYEYMGAITLLLAMIGLYYNRKNKLLISLAIFAGFLTLLSFGRHADWFYSIFYNYIPFFNKFRAPMMSVTVTFFIMTVFAGFGLNSLKNIKRNLSFKEHKPLLIILGSFLGIGIIVWLVGQGFSFTKSTGEPYNAQTLAAIKTIRQEMFNGDMLRYIALILASAVAIIAYLKQKIPFTALAILLVSVAIIDLGNIQTRVNKKYINVKKLEKSYFGITETDQTILTDKSVYRVYPLGEQFGNNRWAYYHQSISGYTPIKMFTIEEFVQNNLQGGRFANRNIMQILNVKYLVSQSDLRAADLQLVNKNQRHGLNTYLYIDHLKRGFFVGEYTKIEDEFARLKELNKPTFKVDSVAILEVDLPEKISTPDSSVVSVLSSTPNLTEFKVFTDKQALFVISEIYYPPGWKVLLDGQEVENIYKTDHAIQSIVVPAGEHTVELKFEPESYENNVLYAAGSLGLLYLVIVSSAISMFLKNKNEKVEKAG